MIASRLKEIVSPVRFISVVSIVITGLSALLGIFNARLLGPEALGLIAVIAGVYASVATFADVRLTDVVAKLYYRPFGSSSEDKQQYRASVVQIFVLGSGTIGLLIFLIGLPVTHFAIRMFTDTPIKIEWIFMSGLYFSLNYWIASFQYQQRFSERYYLIGTWKLIGYLLSTPVFLLIVIKRPDLDGYFLASLISTILNACVSIGLSIYIWIRCGEFHLLRVDLRRSFPDYIQETRLIIWGNVFSYSKMLHRGFDILVVGYFADDRTTGLYKIARTAADLTFVLYESINQVYYPRFMQLLSERNMNEYRRLVIKIISRSVVVVLGILFFEWLGLRYLVLFVLTTKFLGAESAIMILSSTLFFILGFHLWLWPIFVQAGKLERITGFSILAGLAQYLIVILGFKFWGVTTTAIAALGYLGYYLILTPIMLILANSIRPELFVRLRKENILLSISKDIRP